MGKKQLRKKYNLTEKELNQCFKESYKLGLSIEDYLKSKIEKDKDTRKEILTKYNYHNNFTSFDDTTTKQFCIDFIFSEWFKKSGTLPKLNKDKEVKIDFNQSIKHFLSVEKHLNNQLYWILFGFLYIEFDVISKSNKDKLRESVTKDRLSISLEDRSKLCFMFNFISSFSCNYLDKRWDDITETDLINCVSKINDKNYDNYQGKSSNNKLTLIKRLSKYLTRRNKKGHKTIKVYRGFSFNKKSSLKVMDKSKTFNNQILGEGMSYTFDKNVSLFFSLRSQDFGDFVKHILSFIVDVGGTSLSHIQQERVNKLSNFFDSSKKIRDKMWNEDELIKDLKNIISRDNLSFNRQQSFLEDFTNERTGYYGNYEIKIDDILFISNRFFEKECVSFNYKLLQYKVVDIKLIQKMWFEWGIHRYGSQYNYKSSLQ
jgi:hypothetical protein